MERVKRILKRWPGVVTLIAFFAWYQVAMLPITMLGLFKSTSVLVQTILTIIGLILMGTVIWGAKVSYQKWPAVQRYFQTPRYKWVIWVGLLVILLGANWLYPGPTSSNEVLVERVMRATPIGASLMVGVIGPIIEELIFRGIFFRRLLPKISSWQTGTVGVVINALIFGSLHASLFSVTVIPYVVMGALFAIAYLMTNDLRYSMALHIINNSLSVVLFFL